MLDKYTDNMVRAKFLIIVCALLCWIKGYSQTEKLSGTYSYGKGSEDGYGYLRLYSMNDSTILFYIENGRGAPSYNSGSLEGSIYMKKDLGMFVSKDSDWVLRFYFQKNSIKVVSKEYKSGSGYGYGVSPDGEYERKSSIKREYFINREGDTTYFKQFNHNK